ncbi:SpoVR family protein [Klebsiella pneumoniae]|nr:SpoVR family protein [Klebsiella pneumoniae]
MATIDSMNRDTTRLSDGPDWTFELLETYLAEVDRVAKLYRLDTYPHQIEVITSEQMMDAYSSVGMPINYPHWSFGKKFIETEQAYKHGQQGLAYEIVINSNPCIAYLMEENTITMQALVMAHACYGHNSFFKNNYLFRSWTDASSIIDYLIFARKYITECEERYGVDEVEKLLDSCHALMNYGVDRYKRPQKISLQEEKARQKSREEYLQSQVNMLWRTLPKREEEKAIESARRYPSEPQENLLYFMEKNAPLLEPWQREILRIVRKVSQYFYPQKQTQVMNEERVGVNPAVPRTVVRRLEHHVGMAVEKLQHKALSHFPFIVEMVEDGVVPEGGPLGFAMFQDIKRICQSPTEEDKYWFPDIAGSDWLETLHFAMRDFKDESFISQFLSPKIMRDFRFFTVLDDDHNNYLEISAIHNEEGYREIRNKLSAQYNLSNLEPNIQVWNVDLRGDRSLTLRYVPHNRVPLDKGRREVLKHVHRLWGFDVLLEQQNADGSIELLDRCPARPNAL